MSTWMMWLINTSVCDRFWFASGETLLAMLHNGDSHARVWPIEAIKQLAAGTRQDKEAVLASPCLPNLVKMLEREQQHNGYESIYATLGHLAAGQDRDAFVESILPALITPKSADQAAVQELAAAAMLSLANGPQQHRKVIIAAGKLPAVACCLQQHVPQEAAEALLPLLLDEHKGKGATNWEDCLVLLLQSSKDAVQCQTLEAIGLPLEWWSPAPSIRFWRAIVSVLQNKLKFRREAAAALGSAMCQSRETMHAAIRAGGLQAVLALMDSELARDPSNQATCSIACSVLLHLSCVFNEDTAVIASGAIRDLVDLLNSAKAHVRIEATQAVSGEGCGTGPQLMREAFVAAGIAPALVALLRPEEASAEATAAAVEVLSRNDQHSLEALVSAGALPALVALLKICTVTGPAEAAAKAIEGLARVDRHSREELVTIGAVPALVAILGDCRAWHLWAQAAAAIECLAQGEPVHHLLHAAFVATDAVML